MASRSTTLDIDLVRTECRTFGHAWERYEPTDYEKAPPRWGWRFSVRCSRGCGVSRHDIIDRNGDVQERNYDYPKDYKYAAEELPSRSDFRVLLHTALKNASSDNGSRRRLRSVS